MRLFRPAVVSLCILAALPLAAVSLAAPQLIAQAEMTPDQIAWDFIRTSTDISLFERFIAQFPDSPLVLGAKLRIEALKSGSILDDPSYSLSVSSSEEPSSSSESSSQPPSSSESSSQPPPSSRPSSESSSEAPPPPSFDFSFDVQRALKRVGCYAGSTDGVWDAESREALARFSQAIGKDLGTEPTVGVMMEVQSRPDNFCDVIDQPDISISSEEPPPPQRDYALDVQRELKRVFCYSGPLDGDWGKGSRTALRNFNSATGQNLGTEPTVTVLAAVEARKGRVCPEAPKPKPSSERRPDPDPPPPDNNGCFIFNGTKFCGE